MSLNGEAIAAIRSVIRVDERVQSLAGKVERLADEMRVIHDRLVRLETFFYLARGEGTMLRIASSRPERKGRRR